MCDFDSLIICLIEFPIKCRDPVGVGSDKPIIFRGSRSSNIWVCRLIMFIKNLENEWFLSKEAANCGYAAAHPVPPPLHYYFKERLSNQSFLEEIHILKIFEIQSKWFLPPKEPINWIWCHATFTFLNASAQILTNLIPSMTLWNTEW